MPMAGARGVVNATHAVGQTLMCSTSLWPCSTALALLANLITRSLTLSCSASPGLSFRWLGSVLSRSLALVLTLASTVPRKLFVRVSVAL
jgi:hypothetical protein